MKDSLEYFQNGTALHEAQTTNFWFFKIAKVVKSVQSVYSTRSNQLKNQQATAYKTSCFTHKKCCFAMNYYPPTYMFGSKHLYLLEKSH